MVVLAPAPPAVDTLPPAPGAPPPPPAAPPAPGAPGAPAPARPGLPGVRDLSTEDPAAKAERDKAVSGLLGDQAVGMNPEVQAATEAAILRLLGGGGFDNLEAQQNILRAEGKNAFRDASLRNDDTAAAMGVGGSGGAAQADARLRQGLASQTQRGLTDLNSRSQQFGLEQSQLGLGSSAQQRGLGLQQATAGVGASQAERGMQLQADQLGINRDLGLRGQDLQDQIARRQASVQRYGIDTNAKISEQQLQFNRDQLTQEMSQHAAELGYKIDQQEIDKGLAEAGLLQDQGQFEASQAQQNEQFGVQADLAQKQQAAQEALGLGHLALDQLTAQQQAQIQQYQISAGAMGMAGFPSG